MSKAKTLILFRGTCGAGKTHVRKRMGLDAVVGLDMADYDRSASVEDRVNASAVWLSEHDKVGTVWIEGIFAPDSPSLKRLEAECARQKRHIQHVIVSTDAETLKERIGSKDPERLMLALRYAGRFWY